MSLGLAILTKGSAYSYGLPFLLYFILTDIKRNKLGFWKSLVVIFSIIVAVNLGHYIRNFELFGSPLSTYPYQLSPDIYGIPELISSGVKNASLHMAIPLDFFNNTAIEKLIYGLHQFLHVDINDPRITMDTNFSLQNLATYEDTAGNPLHFWLFLFTLILFISNRSLRKNKDLFQYIITVICAFLLFCLLLKWQLWHSRLHLPIFVLISPFMGIVLAKLYNYNPRIANCMIILIIQTSLLYVLFNETRPLIAENNIFNTNRMSQYFKGRVDLEDHYINAVKLVHEKGCHNVGLSLRPDAWEYPLWVLLKEGYSQPLWIEHINVKNPSSVKSTIYPYRNFIPCAIISVGSNRQNELIIGNRVYVSSWKAKNSREPVQVFLERPN